MKKKAIILDLDNTIYPVSSIGEKLFSDLFRLIQERGGFEGDFGSIKAEIMRTPFQKVARAFSFSSALYEESMSLLRNLTYNDTMVPFEDYQEIHSLKIPKYLVTVGFLKMQQSKVQQLGIEKDFEAIVIIDPEMSKLSKKDIFGEIMNDNGFAANELLIVGDDPESEIKAAQELGIDSVLYDRDGKFSRNDLISIKSFRELKKYI